MLRSPAHLAFIRKLSCLACGASSDHAPVEAAHVRIGGDDAGRGGMGLKPADSRVVPLCAFCHQRQHTIGERRFWDGRNIDPHDYAARLYGVTGNMKAATRIMFTRHFEGVAQ